MSLRDCRCIQFELHLYFSSKQFNRTAFERAVKRKIEDDTHSSWTYVSKDEKRREHAHISLFLSSESKHRARFTFLPFQGDATDGKEPFLEDCVNWFGSFIKSNVIKTAIRGEFFFDEQYLPVVSLPFPIVGQTKDLAGSIVKGMSIEFPPKFGLDLAIIQSIDEYIAISAFREKSVSLKRFNLDNEVKKITSPVMALVRKVEKDHDSE